MAAVTRRTSCHFARQFKAATGLPPHQYVIMRRVERAKQFLQSGTDLSLADVAIGVGFSDQSQFSKHFKRLVGVTPRQFGVLQEAPESPRVSPRNSAATPPTIPHRPGPSRDPQKE
jgi:AraC-like DNA-binding protein